MAQTGLARVIDFQDVGYGADYLARLQRVHEADKANGGAQKEFAFTREMAKYLAAAMAYSDVIRARDGRPDEINCGPGDDVAYVDRVEDGVYDCERVLAPEAGRSRP